MKEEQTIVYFLQSVHHFDKFYVGITRLSRKSLRLEEHNRGQARATKKYIPWIYVHIEIYDSKSEAVTREYYLKSIHGYKERRQLCDQYKKEMLSG